jgi:catechol 2,3-dioxygenase-like lactoylglutathione lyase family enzyme
MAQMDIAIPALPAKSTQETIAFYEPLGFRLAFRTPDDEGGYAILRRGTFELHFFLWPDLVPESNFTGAYLRASDIDALYRDFSIARLPARGIPSLGGIEKKFYRMREFRLVDPNGNLLRVGEPLSTPAFRMKDQ